MSRPRQPLRQRMRRRWSSRLLIVIALGASLLLIAQTFPVTLPFPSIDGTGNNLDDPEMNAASTPLKRKLPVDYSDGASMAGDHRKSPREISNLVNAQNDFRPNRRRGSAYIFQWGQFLDHDISLTGTVSPPEPQPIVVPKGDPHFDPQGLGGVTMSFNRSIYDHTTGDSAANPRQQMNQITGWIDASMVYGSDQVRAEALRTLDGTGKLRTSEGNLLPFNDAGLPNNTSGAGGPLFLAGDVRANEQVALAALHALFVREHNRLADEFRAQDPGLSGDVIYEKARRMVAAFVQAITYREFLPAVLGRRALARYRGYDPSVDARIVNGFSNAAFRLGHSMLPPRLLRLDRSLHETAGGHLLLRDAFFAPERIIDEGGIDPLLRGLAYQVQQNVDVFVVDGVRNFLFGPPGAGGLDLPSLNIQRGRDHGLPDYNTARAAYGLQPVQSFEEISSDPEVVERLKSAYDDVDHIDLWVGGLAEDHVRKALVGPLFHRILTKQFEALRNGDRFYYENQLSRREIRQVNRTKLSHIIRRNTTIGKEIPRNVFRVRRWRRWLAKEAAEWEAPALAAEEKPVREQLRGDKLSRSVSRGQNVP